MQLRYIDQALEQRKVIDETYRRFLKDVKGIRCIENTGQLVSNYPYFPILVELDYPLTRDALYDRMRQHNIYGRRYFYPLISDFPMYRGLPSAQRDNLPAANRIANQVICLPIYPGLTINNIKNVVKIITDKSFS